LKGEAIMATRYIFNGPGKFELMESLFSEDPHFVTFKTRGGDGDSDVVCLLFEVKRSDGVGKKYYFSGQQVVVSKETKKLSWNAIAQVEGEFSTQTRQGELTIF
jgi:hypothetical protein